jgi:hypothetical protein
MKVSFKQLLTQICFTVTGSATGRLTSWTDYSGIRYTPTSIPPNSGITTTPLSAAVTPPSSSTISANLAAGKEVEAADGFLAAVLCVAALL